MTFETKLLDVLHEAADAPVPAPRRPVAALGVGVAVLIAAVLLVPFGGGAPAIAVERDADGTTVRLLEVAADPERVQRELREAGIDATVVVEPAAPDLVGRWTSVEFPAPGPIGTVDDDEIHLPADVSGPIRIGLGREAQPGETTVLQAPRAADDGCGTIRRRAPAGSDDVSVEDADAAPACGPDRT